jgi:hypothetical protein
MITVRRAIRWITWLLMRPVIWIQGSKPRRIASQFYPNGAREDILTQGQHTVRYSTGDFVRFGKNSEVIEIKTHDGIKWSKNDE